jgi:outer membrane protein assembly factor BamA
MGRFSRRKPPLLRIDRRLILACPLHAADEMKQHACRRGPWLLAWIGLGLLADCAAIPKGQYGVNHIEWKGVKQMSRESLEACLATKEREHLSLRLGLGGSSCGDPPFDEDPPKLSFWAWPWTDWPVFDPAIFDVDKKRIARWYQARGFYDAKVTGVDYSAGDEDAGAGEHCTGDDCALTLHISVDEGLPVVVRSVTVGENTMLPMKLVRELRDAARTREGERFDEAVYDADKGRMLEIMHEHTYARAEVDGRVTMDRGKRVADVAFTVDTGPPSRFGHVTVEGSHDIPADAIIDVANIPYGDPYEQSVITDAERAVYGLGVFSAVRIESRPRDESDLVDLIIHVSPGRIETWRAGVGIMSGTLTRAGSDELFSVPEWDVHLRGAYTSQNFLGGMRKLRLEERPRLIFLDSFPGVPDSGARLGNTVIAHFEQPRFPERRTVLFSDAQWDIGPDPFLGYFRHDVVTKVGQRRKFIQQTLTVEVAAENDIYEILTKAPDTVSSYRLPFLEQTVRLDLRNDPQRATRGVYVANTVQEALTFGDYGSWHYVRVLPEARAYQKLFWNIVLAERVAFGAIFIDWASDSLDPTSQQLGPQAYRLRGGGANSNRGFLPGTLGDGIDGGKRRWEGSVEARIPLSHTLSFVVFFDTGDVSRSAHVRFDHINAATGFGLRFYTPFAPIRFDAGWRIPAWQVVGGEEPPLHVGVLPSAAHLTIGEAF